MQDFMIRMLMKLLGELITPELVEKAKVEAVCWAKGQVANTANKIDDQFVEILAEALGVDCPK